MCVLAGWPLAVAVAQLQALFCKFFFLLFQTTAAASWMWQTQKNQGGWLNTCAQLGAPKQFSQYAKLKTMLNANVPPLKIVVEVNPGQPTQYWLVVCVGNSRGPGVLAVPDDPVFPLAQ